MLFDCDCRPSRGPLHRGWSIRELLVDEGKSIVEHTAAAITAVIQVAKNQKTKDNATLLIDAIESTVKAVQTKTTESIAIFIVRASKAAVPDFANLKKELVETETTKRRMASILKVEGLGPL